MQLRLFTKIAVFLLIGLAPIAGNAQHVELPLIGQPQLPPKVLGQTAPPNRTHSSTLDRLHGPLLSRQLMINGSVSCAAASCHGGPRPAVAQPTVTRGSEYQLWRENDPHARSWSTICSSQSVEMMERLGILDHGEIVDQAGFDNCLACHNTTKRFDEPRSFTAHYEGVGCAACHGPSERWASSHYQHGFSPQLASSDGFVNAGNLYVRARMCASCHVGDKDRDMNHDIIAAGHPALKYEFATYHARLPKHWRDHEARDETYYEAQLWLAGQVASSDTALSLLNARASDSHTVSQWPEFATYDCASCHHSLGLRSQGGSRQATPRYSAWNDSGLRWVIDYREANGEATSADWQLLESLDAVRQVMQSAPIPDEQSVKFLTQNARNALAAWYDSAVGTAERRSFRSNRLGHVLAHSAGRQETFSTWESAVQFHLAAVAARASWSGGWTGPVRDWSDALRAGLRYPDQLDINRESLIPGQPTITSDEAMRLGIGLAGQLGPIVHQPPAVDTDNTQELRRQLREMIEQINEQWDKIRSEAAAEAVQPQAPPQPRRRPKTAEELLEELRRQNSDRDPNE